MRYADSVTGEVFAARNAAGIVLKLKESTWLVGKSKGAYMRGVADRCEQIVPGAGIDARDPVSFLATLVAAGFLKKEKRNERKNRKV